MAYNLTVDLAAVNGGVSYAILTGKSEIFPYSDGKKTSDEAIGMKLTLALQNSRLSPLTVKFDHDPLPSVDDSQIEAACGASKFIYVRISDCKVKVYSSTGSGLGMTATGAAAEIVTPGGK